MSTRDHSGAQFCRAILQFGSWEEQNRQNVHRLQGLTRLGCVVSTHGEAEDLGAAWCTRWRPQQGQSRAETWGIPARPPVSVHSGGFLPGLRSRSTVRDSCPAPGLSPQWKAEAPGFS